MGGHLKLMVAQMTTVTFTQKPGPLNANPANSGGSGSNAADFSDARGRTRGRSRKADNHHGHPSPYAFAYSIDEVKQMGGPGRTKTYELVNRGVLKSILVAGRRKIVGDSLRALLSP